MQTFEECKKNEIKDISFICKKFNLKYIPTYVDYSKDDGVLVNKDDKKILIEHKRRNFDSKKLINSYCGELFMELDKWKALYAMYKTQMFKDIFYICFLDDCFYRFSVKDITGFEIVSRLMNSATCKSLYEKKKKDVILLNVNDNRCKRYEY